MCADPARKVQTQITNQPIDARVYEVSVSDPGAGAIVSFAGVVRDHDAGRAVISLHYEAHPAIEKILKEVIVAVAQRFPVTAIAATHRIGELHIGDTALVCVVSAAHRKEAFACCIEAVDAIKTRVPIWKHQRFADSTEEWVG